MFDKHAGLIDPLGVALAPGVSDIVCQIVRGEIEAAVVARTDELVAFLDHRPVFKGHVLVAPVATSTPCSTCPPS